MTDRNLDLTLLASELLCINVADSMDFYCGILGFSKLYGRDNPPFAFLDREGSQLMLEQFEPDSWLTGDMHRPFGCGINFQIEVSYLAPLLQALENVGTALFLEPEEAWYTSDDQLYGQHQFLVQGPNGYLPRFCQDLGERMQDNLPETGRIRE